MSSMIRCDACRSLLVRFGEFDGMGVILDIHSLERRSAVFVRRSMILDGVTGDQTLPLLTPLAADSADPVVRFGALVGMVDDAVWYGGAV